VLDVPQNAFGANESSLSVAKQGHLINIATDLLFILGGYLRRSVKGAEGKS
jgi:hypothetical protein